MTMKRCTLLVFFLAWAFALLGCSQSSEIEPQAEKTVTVRTMDVTAENIPVVVEAVGRIAPDREVVLAAEIGGVVKAHLADVGDVVAAGQVVVDIDPEDYRLALNEAEANLTAAQARYDAAAKSYARAGKLLPREVISPDAFDAVEAEFKTARANVTRAKAGVDIARETLTKTRIAAPFPGIVAERLVEVGQTVGRGESLMTLVDLDRVRIKIYIPEKDYVHLDRDDPVSVYVEAFPDNRFNGRVDRIWVKADPRTNTFGVEVLVDNPDRTLKGGLSARVAVTTQVVSNAVLVPQSAVLYRETDREVFLVGSESRAEKRIVQLGRMSGGQIQVLDGLRPGDRLIVAGQQYLKAGDPVNVAAPDSN